MNVKKVITVTALITGIGAVIYGLYYFYKTQIALALQYCYKIDSFKIISFDKNKISIQFFIKVQNRSEFSCTILGYDLNIHLNEKLLANVKSDKEETLLPNTISTLSLIINVDPQEIFDGDFIKSLLIYFLTDRRKIIFKIQGDLKIKMNFIRKRIKLDLTMNAKDLMATDPESEKKKTKCDII